MSNQKEHLHAEPEYRPRARYGVVACVTELGDGKIRLTLDDLCSDAETWPQTWQSHWPFTHRDFDRQEFLECRLGEDQLSWLGLMLVGRLSALTSNPQQ